MVSLKTVYMFTRGSYLSNAIFVTAFLSKMLLLGALLSYVHSASLKLRRQLEQESCLLGHFSILIIEVCRQMGFCGPILGFCVRNMQPNIKPRGAGIIMIVYGLLVLVLGIYLLMIASNVVEVKIRYDNR